MQKNGAAAGYTASVKEIAYVNHAVWQENTSNLWWKWDGTTWPGSGTPISPLPASKADDTLTVRVQETAWQGDAKFNVKVDGAQVGGTLGDTLVRHQRQPPGHPGVGAGIAPDCGGKTAAGAGQHAAVAQGAGGLGAGA